MVDDDQFRYGLAAKSEVRDGPPSPCHAGKESAPQQHCGARSFQNFAQPQPRARERIMKSSNVNSVICHH